ncbi:alpha/beta fold hydrolase [uncultured Jatrophihabitans sp.]|uniref:alpha/beta fold hydrolase n=1 Tax=uncultured Jatrophihabitans sp. TaxID=1610747 RepID=UPI0035C99077
MTTLKLDDGRDLRVRISGPEDGLPLLFHHGTGGGLLTRQLEAAVHRRGARLVIISRAGYATSTRSPGRAVVDVVADSDAVFRALGVDRYFVAGWSGGGPHALACAARLPGVIGTLVVSGLAPYDGEGLDFLQGMARVEVDEWEAALQGESHLREVVSHAAAAMLHPHADPRAFDETGDTLVAADAAVLTGEFAEDLAAANRVALSTGVDGWVDDELAFVKPWGFDLGTVDVPVSMWHGSDDRNVPLAHSQWVAEHLPDASLHRAPGEGHLSVLTRLVDPMLDELLG